VHTTLTGLFVSGGMFFTSSNISASDRACRAAGAGAAAKPRAGRLGAAAAADAPGAERFCPPPLSSVAPLNVSRTNTSMRPALR